MASTGISYLLELYECPPEMLDDQVLVEAALVEAVDQAQATLLELASRRFVPQGVTAFALLAESHLSIHTWPELGYAAVDIFTCGGHTMPDAASDYLVEALMAGRHELKRLERGSSLGVRRAEFCPKPVAAVEAS